MAAVTDPMSPLGQDLVTASDVLSLHTLDNTDVLATQEQEDADLALALALEEQESQRYARTQMMMRGLDPNQINTSRTIPPETSTPYRDTTRSIDSANEQSASFPPYRDDPDAIAVEEAGDSLPPSANRPGSFMRIMRKLFKMWLCCFAISTILTILVILVVFVFTLVYGTKVDNTMDASGATSSVRLQKWQIESV